MAVARSSATSPARARGWWVWRSRRGSLRRRLLASGARYLVGRAQALPLEDASVDLAVFMRTLHHVPAGDLIQALREARRVLRQDGAVYVAEPLPKGDYFALTSLVEDEEEVRKAAQHALAEAWLAGLDRVSSVDYDVRLRIADLAALRTRVVNVDPERADVFDSREAELTAAFERLGEPDGSGGRSFLQPMRADVLRPIVARVKDAC